MKDPQFIKDMMDPAVRIEADMTTTTGDLLRTLEQWNVPYGVVCDVDGKPLVIVTKDQLSSAKLDEPVQAFTVNIPRPVPIEPYESLDIISQTWAKMFATGHDYTDIVLQEPGNINILRVLSREKIKGLVRSQGPNLLSYSLLGGSYVGYPVGRLEGLSLPVGYSVSRRDGSIVVSVPPDGKEIVLKLAPGDVLYICSDCPRTPECPEGPDGRGVAQFNPNDPPKCKWHQHVMTAYEEE